MLGLGVKISRGEFIQLAINKFLLVNKIQLTRELWTGVCLVFVDEQHWRALPLGARINQLLFLSGYF